MAVVSGCPPLPLSPLLPGLWGTGPVRRGRGCSSGPRAAGLSEEGALRGTCGWALQVKEERLAEEKAKKKAAAKKMEEAEARRKQEEEARRLRRLQQVHGQRGSHIKDAEGPRGSPDTPHFVGLVVAALGSLSPEEFPQIPWGR